MQWLDARGDVPKPTPTKTGDNIVEWSVLSANVLDFRICLRVVELRR